jgi:uncharacterized SAM-binding protein YcdF (DUF218 family)
VTDYFGEKNLGKISGGARCAGDGLDWCQSRQCSYPDRIRSCPRAPSFARGLCEPKITMEIEKGLHRNIAKSGSSRKPVSSSWRRWVKWPGQLRLVRRRTVWFPTCLGSILIASLLLISVTWWFGSGESFLSLTQRLPAHVLVVEGWIGRPGIRAAVAEFGQRGYQYIVPTGGLTSGRWEDEPASYAEMAAGEMIRSGVPKERIIVATPKNTESHRTFESAVAVWRALQAAGIQPKTVNVFTFGPHARRSRLVFAKVDEPGTDVGVIGWIPPGYVAVPWWRSSERARDLLEETAGYMYEVLFNSGRSSNSPVLAASSDSVRHPNSTQRLQPAP